VLSLFARESLLLRRPELGSCKWLILRSNRILTTDSCRLISAIFQEAGNSSTGDNVAKWLYFFTNWVLDNLFHQYYHHFFRCL
jgi:hypothetical protein